MSSYATCLIRKSDTPMSLEVLLLRIVVNHGQDPSNKFGCSFLIKTIRVGLLSCRNFLITTELMQLFSNSWLGSQIDTQTLRNLRIGVPRVNVSWYSMPFQNFGRLNCIMALLSSQTVSN